MSKHLDPFDARDFYELMQAYRHAHEWEHPTVIEAFEAVKDFVRNIVDIASADAAAQVDIELP